MGEGDRPDDGPIPEVSMASLDSAQLLAELDKTAEDNLNRHLAAAQEWMPHEYVPWSQGRDFMELDGEPWSVEQSTLSPIARTALEVNLLTEDNLPSYHREVERAFGRDSAWGTWVNRWTAEEGRHAFCIRDYLLVTRGVDPDELERARMETMETGFDSGDKPLLNVCAYVSFQELATRVSHRNTGKFTEEPIAEKLLTRVAKDENLHMIFYRNIVQAALELTPSQTMRAITDEVVDFQMPGRSSRGSGARPCRWRWPASTTCASTTTTSSRRCCASGASGSSRGSTPTARRHGRSSRRPWRRSTPRRPGSSRSVRPPRPRRLLAWAELPCGVAGSRTSLGSRYSAGAMARDITSTEYLHPQRKGCPAMGAGLGGIRHGCRRARRHGM